MNDHEQDLKINTLENNYKSMTEKIDELKKLMLEVKSEIKCFREDSDKKYASKLTEIIVYGLVGLILVYVFSNIIL